MTSREAPARARIVDAAAELLAARGVAGTSLDAVLSISRTSKSQLYHYFENRNDLILAVVHRQIECVLAANEPILSGFDSVEALRRWRDALVDHVSTIDGAGGCPLGSLVGELGETPRYREAIASGFAEWKMYFFEGFVRMQAAGRLSAALDPNTLAMGMLGALQGGLLLAQVERSSKPLEAALDMTISCLRP